MDEIAVDVVLLPPAATMRQIIARTNNLPDGPIRLNERDCLPHISFGMGVLPKRNLPEARQALAAFGDIIKPLELSVAKARAGELPNGKLFSELMLEPTFRLTELFLATTEYFLPLFEQTKVTTDTFFLPPHVDPISTTWVQNYYKDKPGGFRPHITLGQGRVDDLAMPPQFTGGRLALCHLGAYCSCRKILAETKLSDCPALPKNSMP